MKKRFYNQKKLRIFAPGVIVRYGKAYPSARYGICIGYPEYVNNVYLIRVWWFNGKPNVINKKKGYIGLNRLEPWPFKSFFSKPS